MIFDYQKLWAPYSVDGHSLENTVGFIKQKCTELGIDQSIAECAIAEIFVEVAGGRTFDKSHCSCGCGIDKAGTDITHAMLRRAVEISRKQRADLISVLGRRLDERVRSYFEAEDAKFIAENAPVKKQPGIARRVWNEMMDRGVVE